MPYKSILIIGSIVNYMGWFLIALLASGMSSSPNSSRNSGLEIFILFPLMAFVVAGVIVVDLKFHLLVRFVMILTLILTIACFAALGYDITMILAVVGPSVLIITIKNSICAIRSMGNGSN